MINRGVMVFEILKLLVEVNLFLFFIEVFYGNLVNDRKVKILRL